MIVTRAEIEDVFLITPKVISDSRGYFFESWNRRAFSTVGIDVDFVQDNHSRSARNVLRGLHYQIRNPQGKLVRVLSGEVFDVAVDLRRNSATFGRWVSCILSSENRRMTWIPPGFAHGFCILSEHAEVLYKTTDYWSPEQERSLAWNDPQLAIPWPLTATPILTAKDAAGKRLADADTYP